MLDALPYLLALPFGLGAAIAGRRYTTAFVALRPRAGRLGFRGTDPDPASRAAARRLVLSVLMVLTLVWILAVTIGGHPPIGTTTYAISDGRGWGGLRGSNPQPAVPQTAALPLS